MAHTPFLYPGRVYDLSTESIVAKDLLGGKIVRLASLTIFLL